MRGSGWALVGLAGFKPVAGWQRPGWVRFPCTPAIFLFVGRSQANGDFAWNKKLCVMKNTYLRVLHFFLALGLTGCESQLLPDGTPEVPRPSVVFDGEMDEGRTFIRGFGDRFAFVLTPFDHGWIIEIRDDRGTEDTSRFTPPWHFVPNPRYVEGWHFRNSDNSGPNELGSKSVNAPQEIRSFIFSPEVGRTIDGPDARRHPSHEEVQRIREFGRGKLTIIEYRLNNLVPGKRAGFAWMKFRVELSWSD